MRKMYLHYDREGDYLEVRFGKPTLSYYEDLENDVFERRDKKTNEVKGYAIFNVQKRKEKNMQDIELQLPIAAN